MRRLFSLLPLLLPLPNLVQAADPVCTLENRVCAENNNLLASSGFRLRGSVMRRFPGKYREQNRPDL